MADSVFPNLRYVDPLTTKTSGNRKTTTHMRTDRATFQAKSPCGIYSARNTTARTENVLNWDNAV